MFGLKDTAQKPTDKVQGKSESKSLKIRLKDGVQGFGGALSSVSTAVGRNRQRNVLICGALLLSIKGAQLLMCMAKASAREELPIVLRAGAYEVHLLRTGASIYRLFTPDRDGLVQDIVLGHPSTSDYKVDRANTYFGCVVGRVANRIENGTFRVPEFRGQAPSSEIYQLEKNDPPNALHGGRQHWGRQQWDAQEFTLETGPAVRFSRTSPHLEAGYPGEVTAAVTYLLEPGTDGSCTLICVMEAETTAATPINMVQHSYFNLAGDSQVKKGTLITDHTMEIYSQCMTPTRSDLITTGEFQAVLGTPYDFSQPAFIGEKILANGGGFDSNWVLHTDGVVSTRRMCSQPGGMTSQRRKAAEVYEPTSGRGMEIETNAPGLQFYTGNFLNYNRGKDGAVYRQHAGLCLETQTFPNSVNLPQFPSPILYPQEHYRHEMAMRFFTT